MTIAAVLSAVTFIVGSFATGFDIRRKLVENLFEISAGDKVRTMLGWMEFLVNAARGMGAIGSARHRE